MQQVKVVHNRLVRPTGFDPAMQSTLRICDLAIDQLAIELMQFRG